MAGDYTVLNFEDVEDMAPKFGMSPGLDSRFARKPLGLEKSGISRFKVEPNFRRSQTIRHLLSSVRCLLSLHARPFRSR